MKKKYLLLMTLAVLLSACSKDPEACFTSAVSDKTVIFSNCSLEGTSYEWEFGDGTTAMAESPSHTYADYGTYVVKLRVTTRRGKTATMTQTVTLAAPTPGNANYVGSYSNTETCTISGPGNYTLTLTLVPGSTTEVTVTNLWHGTFPVVAVVAASGVSFTIARQPVFTGYDVQCPNGTATVDGKTLNLTYSVYNTGSGSVIEVCTATLTR